MTQGPGWAAEGRGWWPSEAPTAQGSAAGIGVEWEVASGSLGRPLSLEGTWPWQGLCPPGC